LHLFGELIQKMADIIYIDRQTGEKKTEKIYKGSALRLLYGHSWMSRFLQLWLLPLLTKFPFFSQLYGYAQKRKRSAKKIKPFVDIFQVDSKEFLHSIENFNSFNEFFIRHLKLEARPISSSSAIIPADGRYYFYQNIAESDGFIVKGKKFDLTELIGDSFLAQTYQEGSMVIARLCPSDYHHFPCDCIPGPTHLINGWYYSVNPLALQRNIHIFSQNKRMLCQLNTIDFGRILFIEVGATMVSSIQQTYTPGLSYKKGTEKGYFEFGGSTLLLLFPKDSVQFDRDLLAATAEGFEMRCLMGQSMGQAIHSGSYK
jgi:phosphatidylserine decarboxylase